MSFQFRLHAVLNLRRHERDLLQQSVAAAHICHAQRLAERDIISDKRTSVLAELRAMNERTSLSITHVIDRQRHAEQLGRELALAETAVANAESQLKMGLKQLIVADQAVRALERLAERKLAEYEISQAKIAIQEFDDYAMSHRHLSN